MELEFLKYPKSVLNEAEKRMMIHKRYMELPDTPNDMTIVPPTMANITTDYHDNDYYEPLDDNSL